MKQKVYIFLLCLFSTLGNAQYLTNLPFFDYVFSQDSLNGFDEEAANKAAISENYLDQELNVKLYFLKREYINNKYNLIKIKNEEPIIPQIASQRQNSSTGNEDFEASNSGPITSSTQIAGWTITRGNHFWGGNSCILPNIIFNPTQSQLIDAPNGFVDPNFSHKIYSVYGSGSLNYSGGKGSKFIRINSANSNYGMEKATKTITITTNDSLFSYSFWPAFLLKAYSPISCYESPAFILKVTDITNNILISALSYSFALPTSACNNAVPCADFSNKNQWINKTINLKAYLGKILQFDFIITDGFPNTSDGYAYLDTEMNQKFKPTPISVSVSINGLNINLTKDTTVIESCVVPASVILDHNFISWSAQGLINPLSGITNPLISNIYGLYQIKTLDENCAYKNYYLDIGFFSEPKTVVINSPSCKGDLVVMGVSGISNFKWNTGDTTANITINPTISAVYTVSSTDVFNCIGSTNINLVVNDCVGLNQLLIDENKLYIFPNPANENITIKYTNIEPIYLNYEIEIINTLGQIVFSDYFRKENEIQTINTKNLNEGVYTLKLIETNSASTSLSRTGIFCKRFVISRQIKMLFALHCVF